MTCATTRTSSGVELRASLLTAAVAAALTACTGTTAGTPDPGSTGPPAGTAPSTTVTSPSPAPAGDEAAHLQGYLETLDQRFTAPEGAVAASAVPSGHLEAGTWRTTVLEDHDERTRPAGNHRLSVHCTGTGSLSVELRIGPDSTSAQLPRCRASTAIQRVELTTPAPAAPTTVTITPAPGTVAALAYALT
ncbi:hypothetical protein [Kineococcus arenarius]|uniref:hypothetical protein n=1 Tax=unclassified Kineococcus TaxID=2621656 RepID=UPI003D7EC14E